MRTFEIFTTDDYVPFISVGMYESMLDPRYMFESDYYELDQEGREELDFDMDAYKRDIEEQAADFIRRTFNPAQTMEKYGVTGFGTNGISSPTYYNYTTDRLIMKFEVREDFLETMRQMIYGLINDEIVSDFQSKQLSRVVGYINRHWQSRSGYVCFMPSSLQELYYELEKLHSTEELIAANYLPDACLCIAAICACDDMLDKHYDMNEDHYNVFVCDCADNLYYGEYAEVSEPTGEEVAA